MFIALFSKARTLSSVDTPGTHTRPPQLAHAPVGAQPEDSFQHWFLKAN